MGSETPSALKPTAPAILKQVPQFLLEEALQSGRGPSVRIIVTQPRRLSALSVAQRVAAERCEPVGEGVGYSVRFESRVSPRTRLTFCTTGLLLRRLAADPDLKGISHVIVDEVHERDLNSDFLLILLRDLAMRRAGGLSVIAMSATVDANLFVDYFAAAPRQPGAPAAACGRVEIPGRSFPVVEYRLEDAIEAVGYVVERNSEWARDPGVAGIGTPARPGGGVGGVAAALAGAAGSRGSYLADASAAAAEADPRMAEYYPGYSQATLQARWARRTGGRPSLPVAGRTCAVFSKP